MVIKISANPVRNQDGGGGGVISGTTWPIEMVHLSKFAEFHKEMNENTLCIVFL